MKVENLEKLHEAVLKGDFTSAISITENALADKIDSYMLIKDYMICAMGEVGARFEHFEYFIPKI
jgi:methanogenic corrinoid protein MtbC1|tara:strand:- start:901 stop:1095 length:195 start_codon:yes stop_codon:yes gene_type:complete